MALRGKNMNPSELWKRYTHYLNIYPEIGLSLDISRMSFGDDFLETMEGKIQEAYSAMEVLEEGGIANPDEQRMVGHYWLRTPELAPTAGIKHAITSNIETIKAFALDVHHGKIAPEKESRFRNILLIGIGGSALGPQLVSEALSRPTDPMKLYFLDNTDPDGFQRTLRGLQGELDVTLVLVVSKSGGTAETRNGNQEVAAFYGRHGLSFPLHAMAITCKDSKLDQLAQREGWLPSFEMWDWVGGRTSLFSAVGLVPAALQGVPILEFLEGARIMDRLTRVEDTLRNPAALLSLMWFFAAEGKGKKDMVILPYMDRLCLMSKYLQQLIMESLGKEKSLAGEVVHQGIAVYGNKGSTDQHAYVQQLRDGINNFFATFIQVLSDFTEGMEPEKIFEVESGITSGDYLHGFFLGTRRALFENGRDSITISLDTLTAKSLGAFIALYERAVGFYATLVGINAYHQPGVEAGKKAASRVIEIQRLVMEELQKPSNLGKNFSVDELAKVIGAPDESETIFKVLEHLSANPRRKVVGVSTRFPQEVRYMYRA